MPLKVPAVVVFKVTPMAVEDPAAARLVMLPVELKPAEVAPRVTESPSV